VLFPHLKKGYSALVARECAANRSQLAQLAQLGPIELHAISFQRGAGESHTNVPNVPCFFAHSSRLLSDKDRGSSGTKSGTNVSNDVLLLILLHRTALHYHDLHPFEDLKEDNDIVSSNLYPRCSRGRSRVLCLLTLQY